MKRCNSCDVEKSLESFNRCSSRPDGLQYRCIECMKAYNKARYPQIRKFQIAAARKWNDENPERYKKHKADWQRRYLKAHPELVRQYNKQRRARVLGALGVASAQAIQQRIDFYGGCCWMCGKQADTIDHVIPLSRGGSNWPANLRPACRSCNSRKHARPYHRTPEAA